MHRAGVNYHCTTGTSSEAAHPQQIPAPCSMPTNTSRCLHAASPTPSHAPETKVPVLEQQHELGPSAVPLLVQHDLHLLDMLHLPCHLLVSSVFHI